MCANASDQPRIVLHVRPGCHLCGPARDVVRAVATETGTDWREVDITDAQSTGLEAAFGDKVPAVTVDGELVAYWRVDPDVLRRALAQ